MRAQVRVERIAHLVGAKLLLEIEMRDLPGGVDAGVGAASARDGNRCSIKRARSVLHHLLDGQQAILPLPAGEGAAVILYSQLVPRHAYLRARGALSNAAG